MTVLVAAVLVFVAVVGWPARVTHVPPTDLLEAGSPRAEGRGGYAGGPRSWSVAVLDLAGRTRRGRDTRTRGPDALAVLDAIAPALRCGLAPSAALRCIEDAGVADRDGLVADLVEAADRGAPLAPVWSRHARSTGSPELALTASAWTLHESLGAPLADVVDAAAAEVRRRRGRESRLAIVLAGPRATVRVLTLLPLSGPVLALLLGVTPAQVWGNPLGAASLLAGVALMLLGRWWCRRMVDALARPTPAGRLP